MGGVCGGEFGVGDELGKGWDFEEAGACQILCDGCLKQDLQDCEGYSGLRAKCLMVGRRILFAVGERAEYLKQDLLNFGGIFGIAG